VNKFKIITITHKTANINHIGRFIPTVNSNVDELLGTLNQIKGQMNINELMYLATCNRLTFLLVTDEKIDNGYLKLFFSALHPDIPATCIEGILEVVAVHSEIACVQHVFEVASSLDSLVVGEREILRQLRDAYDFSKKHGLTGDSIRLMMKMAIPVAKEVYTRTKIGENSVSVVSLAMQEMLKLNPAKNARFLIVGAGQTNTLVAKFLLKYGFKNFAVFNRSIENAEILAKKLNGTAHKLIDLQNHDKGFDVMISCTGASEAVVTKSIYDRLVGQDTDRKIVVDLAVPNDIDRAIVNQNDLNYIEVERLRTIAAENLDLRKQEVVRAQEIINEKVAEFRVLLRKRRVEKAMVAEIPIKVREVREKALGSVFQKEIAEMDANALRTLEKVLAYMEKKYIGIPISVAKDVLTNELTT